MDETFDTIQTLQESISQDIARRSDSPRSLLNHLTIKALQSASARLTTITRLLHIDTYDLVFIGQVGAGKTTSICHLFNLTYPAETTTKGRKRTVIRDLLPTGSGKTTLCELIITPDQSSFFEIEPYSEADLRQIVRDYCTYVWYRAGKRADADEIEPLSAELDRAVGNVVALRAPSARAKARSDTTSGQPGVDHDPGDDAPPQAESDESSSQPDSAIPSASNTLDRDAFAAPFDETQFEAFFEAVWARGSMAHRTRTQITPSQPFATAHEETVWLAQTARKINTALLPDIPIPRKVTIHIGPALLDLRHHQRIGSIIDTKGLDVGSSRQDVARYLRQDNALCLFTDRFDHAPDGVVPLMEQYLTPESQDMHTRSAIFIMPRGEEPEKNVTASGEPAGDWDEGCALRHSHIEAALTGKVKFVSENILFYDAMRFYQDGGISLAPYVDISSVSDPAEIADARQQAIRDMQADKQRVFTDMEHVITRREQGLWHEVRHIRQAVDKIQAGGGLNEADRMLIRLAQQEVDALRARDFSAAHDFTAQFLSWLATQHPMRLRAINNRFGEYEGRRINIYFTAGQYATDLARTTLRKDKDKILARFQDMVDNASVRSDIEPFVQQFTRDIDASFETLVLLIGTAVETHLCENLLAPLTLDNPFWADVQSLFGKGSGYKQRVITRYADELDESIVFLKRTTEHLWRTVFIQPIRDVFGEETI